MTKVLLSGFEPFHKASQNPTQEMMERISGLDLADVYTKVLPVEFGRSWDVLRAEIDNVNPDVVIAFGQAEGRSHITPEKVAINFDQARIPDNAGNQPLGTAIVADGDDGLFTTLPTDRLIDALTAVNIPASLSLSAGAYVCNHLFYDLQSYCTPRNISSGFIHVPLMESQAAEFPGLPTMPIDQLVEAVKVIIAALQQE